MNDNPAPRPILDVLESDRHIRILYRDIIDYPNQRKLLDRVFELYQGTGKSRFIVDTRGCEVNYSVLERHKIGEYVAEKFKNNITLACIIDKKEVTGIVENTSFNRGGTGLKIVTTEKEALEWIGET